MRCAGQPVATGSNGFRLFLRLLRPGDLPLVLGGIGQQAAVLWEHGEIALGPLVDPAPEELVVRGARAQWPFNEVLRRMCVSVAPGQPDEFATVDLGRHRETEDWLDDAEEPGARSA
jgi:hypothetical protein